MTRTTRRLYYEFEAALLRYERLPEFSYAERLSARDSLCDARAALEKRIEVLEKSHMALLALWRSFKKKAEVEQ